MRVVGMLRVRNEARWITRVLASIQPLCPEIFVLDDHSEDGTPEFCKAADARVIHSAFQGLDETRDKDFLLARVMETRPDWIVAIDGDEVLEPAGPEELRNEMACGRAGILSLRVLYLWDRDDQIRVDGVYGKFRRTSVFRATSGAQFRSTSAGGHFHCGNVPVGIPGTVRPLETALLHYGYMTREERMRKFRWYNTADPANLHEDQYRHMIQGDVLEVPIGVRLKHGGPLKLEALSTWLRR